ncbi:diaminopropionate ammonia-lyase [Pseudomonas fontis]|uniref:Diaminopropionate ammonia-lyase n=1 Tax=Pseudomonas fontis TaxID=2942633 RepID=A0ABT5NQ42_9PSED|nr:diaminopropionate ammonia-lyase [Pseudomonas fontis]MDD0972826.1 diaminopropionate ammonia-lyase [Pseudomonas fontis]MDD0990283.1 diaminopropionate ammonia-lyase [Pseudomonas fontis]
MHRLNRWVNNPSATRLPYPDDLKAILNIGKAEQSRAWLSGWPLLNPGPTPLYELADLAQTLGVAQLLIKDESQRSVLGSFKALGAPFALVRLLLRRFPEQHFEPHGLLSGQYRDALGDFTVISATDGNHGKGLAAAAQSVGCRCVIVLHAKVSVEREQAIAAFGAEIVRVVGNYDDSVAEAARLASSHGWQVVSDTSYEGYEDIPRDVMQGYGAIAAEVIEAGAKPTHVILQGGVGGLAAGIVSYFCELYGARRPVFIVVEPVQADCLLQSALAGKAVSATGSVDSLMAGLACGQTSPLAWRFLQPAVDYFMTIDDDEAVAAMRELATGSERDIPLVAGESAVAGLAGLTRIAASPRMKAQVGLDEASRVLLISTEGATAPAVYAELLGETVEGVRGRQRDWVTGRESGRIAL